LRVLRRDLLLGLANAATFAFACEASARLRTSPEGRISLRLPWPVTSLDPHRIDDVPAAILGDALFDTLYSPTRDDGVFVASLAEAEPYSEGATLRVVLREGIRTAFGRPFSGNAAAAAIARARAMSASAWLADVPPPKVHGSSLVFAMRSPERLMRALSSMRVAMVPIGFRPELPDGTGPFRGSYNGSSLVLTRNANAARGPSFLDEVVVRSAADLGESLRAFESGSDDVGWLGEGLHERRPGSHAFDFGVAGFAVLLTGREAGSWDAPGVAQRLCDGIPPSRLAYLGLGAPWKTATELGWGGAPTSLFVREDLPWLVEVGKAAAATLSRPSHEVSLKPVSRVEFTQRREGRNYALALDVVCPFAKGPLPALVALATADRAGAASDLVKRPPVLGDVSVRTLTRTLRCGVVGEVRVQGGSAANVQLVQSAGNASFDFGATTRQR
jgi:peptide/nickel transport system substrate-binding protein